MGFVNLMWPCFLSAFFSNVTVTNPHVHALSKAHTQSWHVVEYNVCKTHTHTHHRSCTEAPSPPLSLRTSVHFKPKLNLYLFAPVENLWSTLLVHSCWRTERTGILLLLLLLTQRRSPDGGRIHDCDIYRSVHIFLWSLLWSTRACRCVQY